MVTAARTWRSLLCVSWKTTDFQRYECDSFALWASAFSRPEDEFIQRLSTTGRRDQLPFRSRSFELRRGSGARFVLTARRRRTRHSDCSDARLSAGSFGRSAWRLRQPARWRRRPVGAAVASDEDRRTGASILRKGAHAVTPSIETSRRSGDARRRRRRIELRGGPALISWRIRTVGRSRQRASCSFRPRAHHDDRLDSRICRRDGSVEPRDPCRDFRSPIAGRCTPAMSRIRSVGLLILR